MPHSTKKKIPSNDSRSTHSLPEKKEEKKYMFYKKRLFPLYLLFLPAVCLYFPYNIICIIITILFFLCTQWSLSARIFLTLKKDKKSDVILYKDTLCDLLNKNGVIYFIYNKSIYIINTNNNNFIDLNQENIQTTKLIPNAKNDINFINFNQEHIQITKLMPNTNLPLDFFTSYKTNDLCYTNPRYLFLQKNTFNYSPPSFLGLFYQHIVAPFFVFQIFCSLLWMLDEYPYHALFTMVMQFIFEIGIVVTRLSNLKEYGTLNIKDGKVKLIYRKNVSDADNHSQGEEEGWIDTIDILPGDIIFLPENCTIPCDLLIIKGSGAVNESLLTGESIPLSKECINTDINSTTNHDAFSNDNQAVNGKEINSEKKNNPTLNSTERLDLTKHKKNILFSGTDLLLNNKLECFVLKTGFDTQQGELVKKMLVGESVSMDCKEAYLFIFYMLIAALFASAYVIFKTYRTKSSYKLLLDVIIILTNVVPPELPMEMTLAVNAALQELIKRNVFCLESFRIPLGGKVEVCCFDKTGTLTENEINMSGIVCLKPENNECLDSTYKESKDMVGGKKYPNDKNVIEINKQNINEYNLDDLKSCIATCHSLIKLQSLIGDPIEKSAFLFFDLIFESETESRDENYIYKVIKKIPFCSEKRRMTVIGERIQCHSNNQTIKNKTVKKSDQYFIAMKGAPEVVKEYLKNVPENYDIYNHYANQGFRVIAVAHKKCKKIPSMESFENDLDFIGFILYECKIKQGSTKCIKELKSSGIECVMITGDNLLTAMNVALKTGLIDNTTNTADGNQSNDAVTNISDKNGVIHYANIKDQLGVEGNDIDRVLESKNFMQYKVFARADPLHKEKIIKKYKSLNKVTLMCGDGTNDVGALKVSDIGVALATPTTKDKKSGSRPNTSSSNFNQQNAEIKMGDASVAAPFTAKSGSIISVLDIIKQGRSTLVTTIQMYKILALNSLISAFSLSILDIVGIKYGDVQMTISGVLIAFAFMFLTKSKSLEHISKKRPIEGIFNKYVVLSVIFQTIIHIGSLLCVLNKITNNVEYEVEGFGMKSSLINEAYYNYEIKRVKAPNNCDTINNSNNNNNEDSKNNNKDAFINNNSDTKNNKEDVKSNNEEDQNTGEQKSTSFRPSLLNSTIFLISISQQINTFTINYIGRPFRESFMENTHLRNSLGGVTAILFALLFEVHEGFSRLMEIVPLNEYKYFMLFIVTVDFLLCLGVEKFCFWAFY